MTAAYVKRCSSVNSYAFIIYIRLCFYGLVLLNLLIIANQLLKIDFSKEEDPEVRQYDWIQYNLLTIWFNALCLLYIPLCVYCDWRELNGDVSPKLDHLRHIRDVTRASILFPVTVYCDLIFWILFTFNPRVIGPDRIMEIVPIWAQHTFHTISFAFVIVDIILTPRQRPKSHKTNLTVMYGFSIIYTLNVYVNYQFGYTLYNFLKTATRTLCVISAVVSFAIVNISYYAQWYLVDYVWTNKTLKLRTRSRSPKFNHSK